MKKIVSLFMLIALIFTFAACKDKADVPSEQAFVKPENYSTVLLITINPQFRLYLDTQDNVLAVEPVNEDAKTVVKDTEFNGGLANVIEEIVKKTNDAGFVKEDATFELQIVETDKELTKAEDILNTAKGNANEAFEKIEVKVEIKASISEDVTINHSTQDASSPADTKSPETTAAPDSESETKPSETEPPHTHSFADATCTLPRTCSCGETEGEPLGHNFKNGKCTVCGAADPDYKPPLTPLDKKDGNWTATYVSNETYYSARITLVGDLSVGVGAGDPLSKMEQEVQDDIRNHKDEPGYKESYIVYEGKEYWSARGSYSPLARISENGDTITLTSSDESEAQIILKRTDENTLTVVSCTQAFKDMVEDIPAGTKLTFKAN